MPRLSKKPAVQPDVLEVIHHEIPENAAAAGAAPIPPPSYGEGGMTWRRMLRSFMAIDAIGFTALLVIAMAAYDLSFFPPLAIAAVLLAIGVYLVPRMTKASTVYSLVVCSLVLVMFGGLFFGFSGFFFPQSWFEMSWAALTTLIPIGGVVAAIATLRHKNGADAAKRTGLVISGLAAVTVVVGLVGTVMAEDATRLPGDVTVSASNSEFTTKAITAKAGDVAIYFDNQDPFAHNVSIKGHGASDIAAGKSVRHVFKAMTAGTYEFFCEVHPDMKGTLTVT